MTTSHSPLRVLKAQSDYIAKTLKQIDRGEMAPADRRGKLAASKSRGEVTLGVVQDDKMIKVTMSWSQIADTSEVAISEFILKHMRGARDDN